MRAIVSKARRSVGAAEGTITLVSDSERGGAKTLVRTRVDSGAAYPIQPIELLLGRMSRKKGPIVIRRDDDAERRTLGLHDLGIQTLVSVPLLIAGRLVGILTVYNGDEGRDFSPQDVQLLAIMGAQSAQVVERARVEEERRMIIQTFGQFISPEVVEEILNEGAETEGARRHVCILFADVRGFSGFAEIAAPEEVVAFLRRFFDLTIDCVNKNHGIVHQLLGDGMMAIFGAPVTHGNDAANAVAAAQEMVESIRNAVESGAIPPTRLGIGLHAGEVVAGTIGSAKHREYKVTGDVVNVAARIEQLNKEFDSTLLVSGTVYEALNPPPAGAEALGPITLNGRREPVQIYRLA